MTRPDRMGIPIALAILVAAVIVFTAATAVGLTLLDMVFQRSPTLSQAVAQRECRKALEAEARQRADRVHSDGIVPTVKSVELLETYQDEGSYYVNATATITLTTGLLPQTEQAVGLTCRATGDDDNVRTEVTNRR